MRKLTPKQEKFCQEYIKLGNKSEAYRRSYSTKNMKAKSVNEKACQLFNRVKVRSRVENLQTALEKRNEMSLDKVVKGISEIATFDIAELYDENGNLLNIHLIPKHVRSAISGIRALEEFQGFGKDRESIGFLKDVKVINKLDAYKELMRYFGGYEKDHRQKSEPEKITIEIMRNKNK